MELKPNGFIRRICPTLENTQLFWMPAMHHFLFCIAWRQADAELEGFVPTDVFTVDVNDIGEGLESTLAGCDGYGARLG